MPHSHSFIAKVRRTIDRHRMLEDGDTIVVAVSGGPDSVALLHLLIELRQQRYRSLGLHLAHVNHGLRGADSDEDERFVRDLAARFGLGFTSTKCDVKALARARGRNIEETAREARYRFLRQAAVRLDARRIATGHTLSDQAETVLMRLIRGAGGGGLSAVRPLVDGLIIRPLLEVSRTEVLDYCQAIGASYRQDVTNLDAALLRNRLRHEILPQLAQVNPKVERALARAAENLRLDEAYFDGVVSQVFSDCLVSPEEGRLSLAIDQLNDVHPAIRRRVLRAAILRLRGHLHRIAQTHLVAVENLLSPGMSGKRLDLPGLTIWREFDLLTVTSKEPGQGPPPKDLTEGNPVRWGSFYVDVHRGMLKDAAKRLPGAVLLDDAKLPQGLRVRARRAGDRYIRAGHRRPRRLKRLMMEHKIPLTQRERWPIVVTRDDDQIVWAPRLPVTAAFAPDSQTRSFALIRATQKEGPDLTAPQKSESTVSTEPLND